MMTKGATNWFDTWVNCLLNKMVWNIKQKNENRLDDNKCYFFLRNVEPRKEVSH